MKKERNKAWNKEEKKRKDWMKEWINVGGIFTHLIHEVQIKRSV